MSLFIFGQSLVRTAPLTETLNQLLVPAVVLVGVFIVTLAFKKMVTAAITVGVIAVIGLGVAALAVNAPDVGAAVAGWIRSVLPG